MIKLIAYIAVFFFSVIGMLFSGVLLHELSHYQDYKNITKVNQAICLLNWKINGTFNDVYGYYSFEYPESENNKFQAVKHTEYKAYIVDIAFMFLFFLLLIIAVMDVIEKAIPSHFQ